jgi:hypothetical protein
VLSTQSNTGTAHHTQPGGNVDAKAKLIAKLRAAREPQPTLPAQEECRRAMPNDIPPALDVLRTKFKWRFLATMIEEYGKDTVVRALFQVESSIARGYIKDLRPGMASRVLESTIKRMLQEDRITELFRQRVRALPILFEDGSGYRMGPFTVRFSNSAWFVDGKQADWLTRDRLLNRAVNCGWTFEPLDEGGARRLKDFPMFTLKTRG